jgi:hypothetical protein
MPEVSLGSINVLEAFSMAQRVLEVFVVGHATAKGLDAITAVHYLLTST